MPEQKGVRKIRNAEFGIIYILHICHENLNSVGADSISAGCKLFVLGKVSVKNGFPVPNNDSDFRCTKTS